MLQQGIQARDRSDPLKDTAGRHLRQGRLGQTLNQPWDKVSAVFGLQVIAYNLIRLGNLLKPVMEAA